MRRRAACERETGVSYLKMVAQAGVVERVRREADAGAVFNDRTAATWLFQLSERAHKIMRANTRAHGYTPSSSDVEIAPLQG
jgi:hypothetical protein